MQFTCKILSLIECSIVWLVKNIKITNIVKLNVMCLIILLQNGLWEPHRAAATLSFSPKLMLHTLITLKHCSAHTAHYDPLQSARTLTIKTPKDHQSALWVWPRLLTTSGAMYSMVPQNEYARLSWSIASLLRPKSESAENILNHQHTVPSIDGKHKELGHVVRANET